MQDRHISNNMRLILDIFDYYDIINEDSYIFFFFDYYKAFDTLEHVFFSSP